MSTSIKLAIIIALVVAIITPTMAQESLREPSRSDLRPWDGALYAEAIERWDMVGEGHYRAEFAVSSRWYDREIILRLGYVEAPYRLIVNGEEVAECRVGAVQNDFNLTKIAKEGLNSVELILTENHELESWRSALSTDPIRRAEILAAAKMTIREVLCDMTRVDDGVRCDFGVVLKSYTLNDRTSKVSYSLTTPEGEVVVSGEESVTLGMLGSDTLRLSTTVKSGALWSDKRAALCRLSIKLNYSGWSVEEHDIAVGARSVECDEGGDIYINGKRVVLVAEEVTEDLDEAAIKRLMATGVNTLLLSAGVDSEQMMDRCDRMGIYVIYTAPINSSSMGESLTVGGNPSNDPAWRERYIERVVESYRTVRHHPSVIALAMAESSANGCNLYDCYLRMKEEVADLPIIYRDNRGEWNSDKMELVIF